jgi:hypothetical protein
MIYDPSPRYIKIGSALSQLLNVSNPFKDHTEANENESVSGRAFRQGLPSRKWIDKLFKPIEDNHCQKAHESDVKKAKQLLESEGYKVSKE